MSELKKKFFLIAWIITYFASTTQRFKRSNARHVFPPLQQSEVLCNSNQKALNF